MHKLPYHDTRSQRWFSISIFIIDLIAMPMIQYLAHIQKDLLFQGALYLLPPRDNHPVPSNPLIAPRCNIHLRCFFQLSFAQEVSVSEKSALLSNSTDEKFPSLGENENVSTMKYVCVILKISKTSSQLVCRIITATMGRDRCWWSSSQGTKMACRRKRRFSLYFIIKVFGG